jgi:hypothetical protein
MDLRALKKTLPGQRIGIEGAIYDQWEGDVLKGIPPKHAAQLLESRDWKALNAGSSAPTPPPQPQVPPEPEPVSEPQEASQAEQLADVLDSLDEDEGYTEEDLKSFTKADLLDFLDETEQAEAKKLSKDALIQRILEGAD